jgi:hypothetical protein
MPLIAEVGHTFGAIYTHSQIDANFLRYGAPLPVPPGNRVNKVMAWLERLNDDPTVDVLRILGRLLQELMEVSRGRPAAWDQHRKRLREVLAGHGLSYQEGGTVLGGTLSVPAQSVHDLIRARNVPGIDAEFKRALENVEADPPAALTAACAILEATFRIYIEDKGLTMPPDRSVQPLWKVVRAHLGLDAGQAEDADMKKIMGGLASVVDGVGALRTHAGTAHGQGSNQPQIGPRHARLAVHAAHTLVTFVLESWG